jgi:hypothetical protein
MNAPCVFHPLLNPLFPCPRILCVSSPHRTIPLFKNALYNPSGERTLNRVQVANGMTYGIVCMYSQHIATSLSDCLAFTRIIMFRWMQNNAASAACQMLLVLITLWHDASLQLCSALIIGHRSHASRLLSQTRKYFRALLRTLYICRALRTMKNPS